MTKFVLIFPGMAVFLLTIMLGVSSWVSPGTIVPLQQATATLPPEVPVMPPEEDSWIIVDLPPDSTQLEYGAEVYRLVCKACHGDKGQGLTDDWRAQWAPEDQNCWQSKCHGGNHPSDGFYMPMSPAVVGPPLVMFDTALDLYNYIHIYMPWHDRGSMTVKESWSVTAYILKINNIDPGSDLNPGTASQIRLRKSNIPTSSPAPDSVSATEAVSVQEPQDEKTNNVSPVWVIAIIAGVVLIFFAIIALSRGSTH
jgi:cytochrome c5